MRRNLGFGVRCLNLPKPFLSPEHLFTHKEGRYAKCAAFCGDFGIGYQLCLHLWIIGQSKQRGAVEARLWRNLRRRSGPPYSIFLKRALQRMLILLREVHDLCDLGFGHFIGENAANADALLMNMNHNPCSLIRIHLKKRLEDMHDKFHRRVIVVQQQHLIQAWLLGFRPRARGEADPGSATIFIIIILRHENLHAPKIG